MLDIALFNEALKVSWIKKYLDPENDGKWKCFFDFQLEKFGGNALPKENLNLKDIKNLKISDPFVKEIFEIWLEVCFEGTITSDDHFLSSPWWHNSSGILRPGSVNQYIQNTRGVVYLSN